MNNELLLQNILRCCEKLNLAPKTACRESGAGEKLFQNIQQGSSPRVVSLAKLANYLGVTTSDLVGDARASPVVSELDQAAADLNDEGRRELLKYAAYLSSKDEYKKYAQTGLGKEA